MTPCGLTQKTEHNSNFMEESYCIFKIIRNIKELIQYIKLTLLLLAFLERIHKRIPFFLKIRLYLRITKVILTRLYFRNHMYLCKD